MKLGSLLLGMAAMAVTATQAQAWTETITFGELPGSMYGYAVPSTYQPLAANGVNVTWTAGSTFYGAGDGTGFTNYLTDPTTIVVMPANTPPLGALANDHTNDATHNCVYASKIDIRFDNPVFLDSLWVNNYLPSAGLEHGGIGYDVVIKGYANVGDILPAMVKTKTVGTHPHPGYVVNANAYSWVESTDFSSTQIKQITLESDGIPFIDDIKVSGVPEPTSLGLLGLGAVALLRRRK